MILWPGSKGNFDIRVSLAGRRRPYIQPRPIFPLMPLDDARSGLESYALTIT